jgi:hypothetical protein
VPTYQFLSDEWLEEARSIRADFEGQEASIGHAIRINLIVVEVPFGEGSLQAHADTTTGELVLDTGHLEGPDLTVTVGYEIAKAMLVEDNPQAGLQAFMQGKIKVDGDISKLLALQSMTPTPAAVAIAERIRAITE